MTSFTLPISSSTSLQAQEAIVMPVNPTNLFQRYQLKWRQNVLYVSPKSSGQDLAPVPVNQLVTRLNSSCVRCVCIDPAIGEEHITNWADACQQTGKSIYLRSVKGQKTSAASPIAYEVMNAILNPVLLVAATVINRDSAVSALYKQWCVGHRGKLFQSWQFRSIGTMIKSA